MRQQLDADRKDHDSKEAQRKDSQLCKVQCYLLKSNANTAVLLCCRFALSSPCHASSCLAGMLSGSQPLTYLCSPALVRSCMKCARQCQNCPSCRSAVYSRNNVYFH